MGRLQAELSRQRAEHRPVLVADRRKRSLRLEVAHLSSRHCSGNGGCHHDGSGSASTEVTHLTHVNPRSPGATRRTGEPLPASSALPSSRVASSKRGASSMSKRGCSR